MSINILAECRAVDIVSSRPPFSVGKPDLFLGLNNSLLQKEDIVARIKQLTDTYCTVIKQHDTFFKVAEGRLKLRRFENGSGELIYYKRSNILGPKLCNYEKAALEANACVEIKNILSASNGCIGTVEKTRQLYMIGQTRIYVDDVEGLGNFLELEVVLTKEDDEYKGEKIAQDLMNKLGVKIEDLISEAYIDLLSKTTV